MIKSAKLAGPFEPLTVSMQELMDSPFLGIGGKDSPKAFLVSSSSINGPSEPTSKWLWVTSAGIAVECDTKEDAIQHYKDYTFTLIPDEKELFLWMADIWKSSEIDAGVSNE